MFFLQGNRVSEWHFNMEGFCQKKKKEKRVWQENCTASSSLELNLNLNWCHHLPFNAQSELPWVSKDKCNSTIFLYIPATVFLFLFVWGFFSTSGHTLNTQSFISQAIPGKKTITRAVNHERISQCSSLTRVLVSIQKKRQMHEHAQTVTPVL